MLKFYFMRNIFEHYQGFIEHKFNYMQKDSAKRYYTIAKNLRAFLLQNKDFKTIDDINSIRFMRLFNQYLYGKFSKGHIKRHLQTIKAFIVYLVNDELIKYNKVRDYAPVLPIESKEIISLTEDEVITIQKTVLPRNLNTIKDLFLCQCYTGLSYIDLMQVNKTMVTEFESKFYFVGSRSKSKNKFTIPLCEKAIYLLEKYNYKLPVISNQKYNKYLKEIAAFCNINKTITTHVGRKTCGQLFLNFGYSIEAVSHILGHADIKTTQMYYARSSFELVHSERLQNVG